MEAGDPERLAVRANLYIPARGVGHVSMIAWLPNPGLYYVAARGRVTSDDPTARMRDGTELLDFIEDSTFAVARPLGENGVIKEATAVVPPALYECVVELERGLVNAWERRHDGMLSGPTLEQLITDLVQLRTSILYGGERDTASIKLFVEKLRDTFTSEYVTLVDSEMLLSCADNAGSKEPPR